MTTYETRMKAFAEEILPMLSQLDFEFPAMDSYLPDVVTKFTVKGLYYTIVLEQCHDNNLTMKFERSSVENVCERYHPTIIETIEITLNRSACTKSDLILGDFRFNAYERHKYEPNMCFYCGSFAFHCEKYHDHINTKTHIFHFNEFITESCNSTVMNPDCVTKIMSFLY